MFVGLRIGVEPAVSGIGIQSGDDQAVLQPLGVIVGPGASVTGHTVARRAGVGLRRIDRRHDHDAGIARPGILVHAIGNHIKAGPRDIVVSLPMRGRKLVGRAAVRLHLVRNGRTHQTARLVAAFRGRKIGKPAAGSRRLTPCRSAGRDRKRIGTAVGRDPSRNLTFDLEIIMRLRNGDLADDFRILRMHEHDLSLPDSRRIVVFERIFRTRDRHLAAGAARRRQGDPIGLRLHLPAAAVLGRHLDLLRTALRDERQRCGGNRQRLDTRSLMYGDDFGDRSVLVSEREMPGPVASGIGLIIDLHAPRVWAVIPFGGRCGKPRRIARHRPAHVFGRDPDRDPVRPLRIGNGELRRHGLQRRDGLLAGKHQFERLAALRGNGDRSARIGLQVGHLRNQQVIPVALALGDRLVLGDPGRDEHELIAGQKLT